MDCFNEFITFVSIKLISLISGFISVQETETIGFYPLTLNDLEHESGR